MHIVTECIIDVNVYLRSCGAFCPSVFLDITYSEILITADCAQRLMSTFKSLNIVIFNCVAVV